MLKQFSPLVLAGLCIISYGCANKSTPTPTQHVPAVVTSAHYAEDEPAITLNMDQFGAAWDANRYAVDQQYMGKRIIVTGKIDSSISGSSTEGYFTLRGNTTNMAFYCKFNERTTPALAQVKEDMVVTVSGHYKGMDVFTLKLEDCKLQ